MWNKFDRSYNSVTALLLLTGITFSQDLLSTATSIRSHDIAVENGRTAFEFHARVYSTRDITISLLLGTPPRIFNLGLSFIDSRTILFLEQFPYLPPSEADPLVYTRKIFEPNASATFINRSTPFDDYLFGQGYIGSETIKFFEQRKRQQLHSNGPIQRLDIVLLEQIAPLFKLRAEIMPADGILGIGPEQGSGSFLTAIATTLDNPVLTFHFRKFNAYDPDQLRQKSKAMVQFGGTGLREQCAQQQWLRIPRAEHRGMWNVKVRSVRIGDWEATSGAFNNYGDNQ